MKFSKKNVMVINLIQGIGSAIFPKNIRIVSVLTRLWSCEQLSVLSETVLNPPPPEHGSVYGHHAEEHNQTFFSHQHRRLWLGWKMSNNKPGIEIDWNFFFKYLN